MTMESCEYLKFENKFRGSRSSILDSLSHYDNLIDTLVCFHPNMNLLDIGCGRGELIQRFSSKFKDSIGIEKDTNMVDICKRSNINVIQGDAIKLLENFDSESLSVITAFHIIEHLTKSQLLELIKHCRRILKPDGILILETPSIDNLLVSTKVFYLDDTHINHINPDGITFTLENSGFDKVNYFYINGGPLMSADPLNLTRVLNGVAQDLLIIACKNENIGNFVFKDNMLWQSKLRIAPSTLEAATDYDFKMNTSSSNTFEKLSELEVEFSNLNNKYIYLERNFNQLRHEMRIYNIFKNIAKYPYIKFKKIISHSLSLTISLVIRILNKFFSNKFFLNFLLKKSVKSFLYNSLYLFLGNFSRIFLNKCYNWIARLHAIDSNSQNFNNKLSTYYKISTKTSYYKKLLRKSIKFK